ncbi:indole-3-glycerol-phosphate synthase TrpC [Bradyrhizobium sp. BRP22]|uniref:indole-3-glycerol-phosphate synthase TrpC n=1 Tax=Bradyrhizobium sp. BRP22 TaxID=2793821 RepID=UPI001CD70D12|nr:indole-3-glycerol-phosphate synthase TrpC [Bradyrhizobium sp. BRP22]MCA1455114.1 indole-3-glycerol-phosphate synthase TrpC [Bradyrhizobium sp. BRP22]
MSDIPTKIDAYQPEEIAAATRALSRPQREAFARRAPPRRGFLSKIRIRRAAGKNGLIAEIGTAAPSKGVIRADFDPRSLSKDCEADGVARPFVLTATACFLGHVDSVMAARAGATVATPGFLFDTCRGRKARAHGTDCFLIVMAAPGEATARDIAAVAQAHDVGVVIEIRDCTELGSALSRRSAMIGINSRKLRNSEARLAISAVQASPSKAQRIVGQRPRLADQRYRATGEKQ